MPDSLMKGEVVVVIGGSSGIGLEVARQFARRGARLMLVARGRDRLEQAASRVRAEGGEVEVYAADLADSRQAQAAADYARQHFGRVDVLVYSAAVFYLAPAEHMDVARAKGAMDAIFWGAVHATQAFLPLVRLSKRKSLVYLASLSVHCTPAFFTAYAAAKHALRGFALALRQELRGEGIHVGVISPGPVDTPLIEGHLHQDLYRLPAGVPVITAEAAAKGVVHAVLRRRDETVLPRWMAPAAAFALAFPRAVEWYYHWTVPGWKRILAEQTKAGGRAGESRPDAP
ncbi:MAG: SDR family NAD(P)-dependent oxidoreductase [Alicyclobacillaceae bacterium]|nr:SDR family NAD(P)-dependent oxidoreductase [Alicyclobacillaceae bacterium]